LNETSFDPFILKECESIQVEAEHATSIEFSRPWELFLADGTMSSSLSEAGDPDFGVRVD
jgi:hypothetical protein